MTTDPNNSTIVRTEKPARKTAARRKRRVQRVGLQAARAGFRILIPHAPSLAARWAERLFLTARRHARPSWEQEALAQAEVGRVDFDGGYLPTWTWSPGGKRSRRALSHWSEPQPPTVILVHGWEGRGSQLATFVAPLLERGLRVVAFDAPGHGDSPLPRASVVEHARALCAVARDIENDGSEIYAVIGHSVGAASSLFATRLGLNAKRFALIAPPTSPAKFASLFARTLGLDASMQQAVMARLEERYAIPFREIDAAIDVARLDAPILVVHDREDPVVAFEEGAQLARLARNEDSTLIETEGLGHRAILRAPHVVDAVTRFVAEGAPTLSESRSSSSSSSFAETLDGELFLRDTRW